MSTASATRTQKIVPRLPISPDKGNEILGFLLGAFVVLLLGSLLSYHPADPSWLHQSLDSETDRVRNFVGPFGAQIAAFSFALFGLVSFLMPALLAIEAWCRLSRHPRSQVAGRGFGIVAILATLPAWLQLVAGAIAWRGESIDSGGSLGVVLAGFLSAKLNSGGAFVVLSAGLLMAGSLVAQSTLKDLLGLWQNRGAGLWRRGLLAWAQRDKRRRGDEIRRRVWRSRTRMAGEERRRQGDRRGSDRRQVDAATKAETDDPGGIRASRSPRVKVRGLDAEETGMIEPLEVSAAPATASPVVRRPEAPVRVTAKRGEGSFGVRKIRAAAGADGLEPTTGAAGGFRAAGDEPPFDAFSSPNVGAPSTLGEQPLAPPAADLLLGDQVLAGRGPDLGFDADRDKTSDPRLGVGTGEARPVPVEPPSLAPPAGTTVTTPAIAAFDAGPAPGLPRSTPPAPALPSPPMADSKPPAIVRKTGVPPTVAPPTARPRAAIPAPPATTPGASTFKQSAPQPPPGPAPMVSGPAPSPVQEVLGIEPELPELPPVNLLSTEKPKRHYEEAGLVQRGEIIQEACKHFGVAGEIAGIGPGPVITVFEFQPAPGVKVSKVVNLQDDLALALKADSVRIDRIPGRSTMGMEVPNDKRSIIHLGQLLSEEPFQKSKSVLTMALGVDIHGRPVYHDLATMPHLLVAGATGAGKSVGLQSMITSILYKANKDEVKFIFIDPKRVELGVYSDIPHLKTEVVVEPKKAANALRWAVSEMERRYRLLAEVHVRSIDIYNRAIRDPEERRRLTLQEGKSEFDAEDIKPLPYYVIIIDELADLMMVASSDVETSIARLAQMARAVGIHLIVATQRPSVDVLTGTIKANFPCRLAFATATRHDSRTILDQVGAEKLLGKGDALFMPPGTSRIMRLHGAYISEQETAALIRWLKRRGKPDLDPEVVKAPEEESGAGSGGSSGAGSDPLFEDAAKLVVRERQGSASFLQRRMRVGFSRAARLIDMLEGDGILGPAQGSKPRDVLVPPDFFEEIDSHKGAVED